MTTSPVSNKTKQKTGSQKARNSAARLLGVQAVYQMYKNDQDAKAVVKEYLIHRIGMEVDGERMVSANEEHFAKLVQGVEEHFEQLSEMVKQNRTKDSSKQEPLLHALLLSGAYELMMMPSIDYPIILSDYVHVAQAFFDDNESKLVNAVLDSIRKTVRETA